MNSTSLCSLVGRYDNPIPPRSLAPIDSLKIPAQGAGIFKLLMSLGINSNESIPPDYVATGGPVEQPYSYSVPSPYKKDCLKIPEQL
jgi:hypothetical protein